MHTLTVFTTCKYRQKSYNMNYTSLYEFKFHPDVPVTRIGRKPYLLGTTARHTPPGAVRVRKSALLISRKVLSILKSILHVKSCHQSACNVKNSRNKQSLPQTLVKHTLTCARRVPSAFPSHYSLHMCLPTNIIHITTCILLYACLGSYMVVLSKEKTMQHEEQENCLIPSSKMLLHSSFVVHNTAFTTIISLYCLEWFHS